MLNSNVHFSQNPRSPRQQLEKQNELATVPVSDPLYSMPEDTQEDNNQLYGNVTNEEVTEHIRQSVSLSPDPVLSGKLRKPAISPKPFKKGVEEAPSKSPKSKTFMY